MTTFDYNSKPRLEREIKECEQLLKNARPGAVKEIQERLAYIRQRLDRVETQEGKFLIQEGDIVVFLEFLDSLIDSLDRATFQKMENHYKSKGLKKFPRHLFGLFDNQTHLGYISATSTQNGLMAYSISFTYNRDGSLKNYGFTRDVKFTDPDAQWEYFKTQAMGYLKRLRRVWHKKL